MNILIKRRINNNRIPKVPWIDALITKSKTKNTVNMYCNVQKMIQQHMLHMCLTFMKHIHVQINTCVYIKTLSDDIYQPCLLMAISLRFYIKKFFKLVQLSCIFLYFKVICGPNDLIYKRCLPSSQMGIIKFSN